LNPEPSAGDQPASSQALSAKEDPMTTNPCLAGLVAVVLSVAAGGSASAQRINYTGQTDLNVSVAYFDVPAGTQVFLVNQVNGAKQPALVPLLSGSGSLEIPIPSGPGQYYVLGQQAGVWVARTVMFYTH
jgi:hypothetical protein